MKNRGMEFLIDLIITTVAVVALSVIFETVKAAEVTEDFVRQECLKVGYHDCDRVVTLAKFESNFNTMAYNPEKHGSYGLLQLQCTTAQMFGFNGNCTKLFSARTNILYGIKYLMDVEKKLKTRQFRRVIAAWNAGFDVKCAGKICTYSNITCKNYNRFEWHGAPPVECYPGEFINEEYVWKLHRYYKNLTRGDKDEKNSTSGVGLYANAVPHGIGQVIIECGL